MIDLAGMRSVRVDPKRRTARAEGRATWGDFDRETQAFSLATTGGSVSDTGIAGLTLGGGLGWLAGKYRLSCDNLLSVDLVIADGKLLIASATENADLFWVLRGGGGNFGVNKELSAKPKQQSQINCPARAKSPLTGESPIQVTCACVVLRPGALSTVAKNEAAFSGL